MLLALQSAVCLGSLLTAKNFRAISFRDFKVDEARKCILQRHLDTICTDGIIQGLRYPFFSY
jgi:hypothetical protein